MPGVAPRRMKAAEAAPMPPERRAWEPDPLFSGQDASIANDRMMGVSMFLGSSVSDKSSSLKPIHPWIHSLHVYFLPGPSTPLQKRTAAGLKEAFARLGHDVQVAPDDRTDVIFSFAPFGEPLRWRDAPFFQARRKFGLQKMPIVWTLIHARPQPWADLLANFEAALAKNPPDLADF